jgi:hypothetical protein
MLSFPPSHKEAALAHAMSLFDVAWSEDASSNARLPDEKINE